MPTSAMRNVEVDAAVPLREIANTLTMMVGTAKEAVVDDEEKVEDSALEAGFDIGELEEAPGDPTVFRCPECGGALWELEDGEFQAYVCHVGHSFSAESLLAQQGDGVERALWTAARLLEEQAGLQERLAQRMGARGLAKSKAQFENKASRASEAAEAVRSILQEAPEDEDGEAA
jgi:two-component system chemotaxis response regulator CheB